VVLWGAYVVLMIRMGLREVEVLSYGYKRVYTHSFKGTVQVYTIELKGLADVRYILKTKVSTKSYGFNTYFSTIYASPQKVGLLDT